ncbi:MAG TPA: DUF3568 domain-containing protein [Isosphaeraceae bacterium]
MRRIVLGAAAIAVGAVGGCSTTSPARSAAGLVARDGPATQTFPRPVEPVVAAAREALADLGVRDVGPGPDPDPEGRRRPGAPRSASLAGRGADGRAVVIAIRSRGDACVASVRVGRYGDEALSRALLDRVGVRLGTLPPAPVPAEVPSTPSSQPFFSRAAVPDAVMLRDQAEAGYHDTPTP